ncbi:MULTISPECIES: hypothetical protein, partial [unclassified Cohnella]|uniref:hypothetical protein n=1 Tax=unclassified Cohnella TaxID=2636738 RepID=UPI001E4FEDB6
RFELRFQGVHHLLLQRLKGLVPPKRSKHLTDKKVGRIVQVFGVLTGLLQVRKQLVAGFDPHLVGPVYYR